MPLARRRVRSTTRSKNSGRKRSVATTIAATTDTPAPTAQSVTDEPLIGPTDVAQMLGVPVSWIYAKSEAAQLPSYKLGHYRRFKRSEIEEYLCKCRSTPNGR
jgi:excisionase family DNA binding protein